MLAVTKNRFGEGKGKEEGGTGEEGKRGIGPRY